MKNCFTACHLLRLAGRLAALAVDLDFAPKSACKNMAASLAFLRQNIKKLHSLNAQCSYALLNFIRIKSRGEILIRIYEIMCVPISENIMLISWNESKLVGNLICGI